jgi:hypothetical protein
MRRPRLVAFHVMMVVAYPVIYGAYAAGWTRLGFAVWVAAFATCLAILVGCASILHAAWCSSGRPISFVGWLRQYLEQWWAGDAHAATSRPSEEREQERTALRVNTGVGVQPGSQAGVGRVDEKAERALSADDIREGLPFLR